MEIKDSFGNRFERVDSSNVSGELKYHYDEDTHTITVAEQYNGMELNCVHYVESDEFVAYKSNPNLQNKQFMVEVFGETQSAHTGEIYNHYARISRATVSGDIPGFTSQKSISAPITYTCQSTPVPVGTSVFVEKFTKNNRNR